MEFELKIGSQGHIYLPKKIRENFGRKLRLLPNEYVGVIFAEDAEPSMVISSLQIIIRHLELAEKKKNRRGGENAI